MTKHFNVSGKDRKDLVRTIAEHLGLEAKYLGVPSCAYEIGSYTISKDGTLSGEEENEELLKALEVAGFHFEEETSSEEPQEASEDAEPDHLIISLPRAMFDEAALENLKALTAAKSTLMKRAFKTESLEITVADEVVSFPWFNLEDTDATQAYTIFIKKVAEMAVKQSRISAKEKEIVNEKYEFRCFLLRLGLIGDEYKATRKQLLKNLSGSAAFKCGHKKGGEEA